ncbi:Zn-dependent exopeptidase, partial [Ramicandelaber brevisporus]
AAAKLFEGADSSTVAWDRLAEMTDLYGSRVTGSEGEKRSIDWIVDYASKVDGFEVRKQPVTANLWLRHHESLQLHGLPRGPVSLAVLGLGNTIPTPAEGIEAPVVVVRSKEELDALPDDAVAGRIVIWNPTYTGYNSRFRHFGAEWSASRGAVASLVKSATTFSHATPHTGGSLRSTIPNAAITHEDVALIERMLKRVDAAHLSESPARDQFQEPKLKLHLNSTYVENGADVHNVIFEIPGSTHPDEIVVISGHIDSWDKGIGAMDDGAGCFIAWEALRLIAERGLKPRRTIRVVMFANEENGTRGAQVYAAQAAGNTHEKHVMAFESDIGVFEPWGIEFLGNESAYRKIKHIGRSLLGKKDYGHVLRVTYSPGEDIAPLCELGVPCAGWVSRDVISGNRPDAKKGTNGYFVFHHTAADRMEVLDPRHVSNAASALAVWAYAVAD